MTAASIDGKQIAAGIRSELAQQVQTLAKENIVPGLAVVLVGDDPASRIYVNMKRRACEEVGVYSEEHTLPASIGEAELLRIIADLNQNPKIHGILTQLPLPEGYDEDKVINSIDPTKDVDGFHPVNVGRLHLGLDCFVPCTPAGVLELAKRQGPIEGKRVVVLGRSNIVGKPVAALFLRENATVTICHSRTRDLAGECSQADILIVAVGRPQMVKGDWIKPGAVVIDVGINRVDGKLVGDVDYAAAAETAGAITPVPGGVGPMTIAQLLRNTVESARRIKGEHA